MALTTASSKLRSTILFSSKEEQTLFKRSSGDLAAIRGVTPSSLLARLPVEQLTKSDLGRWAAQLIYTEDGNCLDAFESLFDEWSAIQPTKDCLDVIKYFFDYCHLARVCIDTTDERIYHLRSNWDSVCLLVEDAAKADGADIETRIQAKTGRDLETLLSGQTALLAITPMLSHLINAWRHIGSTSSAYRVLLDFAHMGKSSRKDYVEPAEARVRLLRIIDAFEEKGVD